MARKINRLDIASVLQAAERWINLCVIEDGSVFSQQNLWTPTLLDEAYHAFADHPDYGDDDFMTKLKRQMQNASASAKQLMAETLWALLLFISNTGPAVKRQQIRDIWALSGQQLPEDHPQLNNNVLVGVASGGPAFTILRPVELKFLMDLIRNLKAKASKQRKDIIQNYDAFIAWTDTVPREGSRQYRHMLRYFAFPDRVERISSNRDRRRILEAYGIAPIRETRHWTDQQLDGALFKLRGELQAANGDKVLDFYEPPLKERWAGDRKVKTAHGEITVEVPSDEDEEGEETDVSAAARAPEARQSIQIQAKLAEIGIKLGFRIWVPRSDRGRVCELIPQDRLKDFLDDLPLNYNEPTIETIEQIDVLWLRRQSIIRAFEVEHTTAVYSGLLRMADLLSLQPNMDIRLHIVAPDERRDKVFREMKRPVFRLLERGPLSRSCTFISYDSVNAISGLKHLDVMKDDIVMEYEEKADT
jgi:hypothetical protein